jgi:hypothetical protein
VIYPGGGYPGEYFPGQADDGQAAIVGAGGVAVGGAATIEAEHLVRASDDLFRAPQKRTPKPKPEPQPIVLQSVAIVGAGGLLVGGAADVRPVRVQVAAYQAHGGLGWRGGAVVETATPIRTRNAVVLRLEALDAHLDDAA